MLEKLTSPTHPRWKRYLLIALPALVAAIFIAFIAGIFAFRTQQPAQHPHPTDSKFPETISAQELEDRYGLRVTLMGVTAGGGMVDFRFKVLDAKKAEGLLGQHENMPQLIPANSKTRLGIPGMHSQNYINGKVYYMLYGNAGGIIRPGTPVKVAFGDVILDAVVAQ